MMEPDHSSRILVSGRIRSPLPSKAQFSAAYRVRSRSHEHLMPCRDMDCEIVADSFVLRAARQKSCSCGRPCFSPVIREEDDDVRALLRSE